MNSLFNDLDTIISIITGLLSLSVIIKKNDDSEEKINDDSEENNESDNQDDSTSTDENFPSPPSTLPDS